MAQHGDDLDDNASPPAVEMEAPMGNYVQQPVATGISPKAVDDVLYSDIGINVLLARLKLSIASAKDFSSFLKTRSKIEDDHAQSLKKLSKNTYETVRRPEGKQGSYALQMADMTRAHERMADHGTLFAASLYQMHDDLNELTANMERGRKHWKQEGVNNEKKVKDAESQMDKAKTRYDSLAEDYERVRTGDKSSSGRVFTVKGPKSAEKHEEDVHRKLQQADQDYQAKVQGAQVSRRENINNHRPQALKAMQELITECDSGLSLQLQKFAAFSERLLVGNGMVVSPLKEGGSSASAPSMREMIAQIDNDRDFQTFVTSQSKDLPSQPQEIRYHQHPTLVASQRSPVVPQRDTGPPPAQLPPIQTQMANAQSSSFMSPTSGTTTAQPSTVYPADFSQGRQQTPSSANRGPPPQTFAPPVQNGQYQSYGSPTSAQSPHAFQQAQQARPFNPKSTNGSPVVPTKPIFGISLEDLFQRDETAIPMIVQQCMQAVDLFGLDIEGIYRLSGNTAHIQQLKGIFNQDAGLVDFRNPENFSHDINSVAGLLKQFLRDLPEPLTTDEHYGEFMAAAAIEEPAARRDACHAVINALPDPNYATLRAIVIHLNRVNDHEQMNRMTIPNLAVCFAPTLMGQRTQAQMMDTGAQVKVIVTILENTFQIFDED